MALPCFDDHSEEEIEESLCIVGMNNIIKGSKSSKLILDFPSAAMSLDDINVVQLRDFNLIDKVIKINTYLDQNFNNDYTALTDNYFKEWALLSGNFFLVCEFGEEVVGLLFTLKLKPQIFEQIINGDIMEKDLKTEDFAQAHEQGSSYFLSFFSLNETTAQQNPSSFPL